MGWSNNTLAYGGGLMLINADIMKSTEMESTTMIGHGGMTYGYKSNQGYNPTLGYSISIMTHNDVDSRQPTIAWC
jgi:hypothetical protein